MAGRITDRDILESHPRDIYTWLDRRFGAAAWLSWDVQALLEQVPGFTDSRAEDKVAAVFSVASNGSFACSDAMGFEKAVLAFANTPCVPEAVQSTSVEEILYGCAEIEAICRAVHGLDAPVAFTGEVPGYVAAVAVQDSWLVLPEELSFAEEMFTHLRSLRMNPVAVREQDRLRTAVRTAAEAFRGMDREIFRESGALDSLQKDTPVNIQVRRILGCYAFDPTLGV